MLGKQLHEDTVALDKERRRILDKFNAERPISPEIERIAKRIMREADRIQGEAFDRMMKGEFTYATKE
jgi:hypothetical protein